MTEQYTLAYLRIERKISVVFRAAKERQKHTFAERKATIKNRVILQCSLLFALLGCTASTALADDGSVDSVDQVASQEAVEAAAAKPVLRTPKHGTLGEILDLCKGRIGIYLDLKDGDVPNLAKIIKDQGMDRDVLWYASPKKLEQLKSCCSQCVPMPDPYLEGNLPGLIDRLRPQVIAAVWKHYSRTFVQTCHQSGAIVIVDESDPSCWEDALAWGSDGIQTDHPEKLIAFLKARDVAARH